MLLWYSNEHAGDKKNKSAELVSSLLRKRTTAATEQESLQSILEIYGA